MSSHSRKVVNVSRILQVSYLNNFSFKASRAEACREENRQLSDTTS